MRNLENYGYFLGIGGTRTVYNFGDKYVIKIPGGDQVGFDYGLSCNYNEAQQFKKYGRRPDRNGIVRARCKLLANGALIMERVDTAFLSSLDRPRWADYIDCWQVGRAMSDGVIVAYDYGG